MPVKKLSDASLLEITTAFILEEAQALYHAARQEVTPRAAKHADACLDVVYYRLKEARRILGRGRRKKRAT